TEVAQAIRTQVTAVQRRRSRATTFEHAGSTDVNSALANVTSSTDLLAAAPGKAGMTTNSRLRQPDTFAGLPTTWSITSAMTQPEILPDGIRPRWTRPPLHSRRCVPSVNATFNGARRRDAPAPAPAQGHASCAAQA